MATSRDFSAMLNQYLPLDLLREELIKRDYLLQKVDIRNDWKGGDLIVPFQGQHASTVEFGALAADTDISKYNYVRGSITTQPEAWSSLIFNHRDLMEHDGKIKESTFLRILPQQIEGMMAYFKMCLSVHLLGGTNFAKFVADTDLANGIVKVDRIDRFSLSQKCSIDDDDSTSLDYYVIAISIENETVTLSATRGGAAVDLTGVAQPPTTAQNAKFYHPGSQTSGMTSLRSQLLSLANGGSTNLFGQAKTAYPYLQAVQVDGSSVTTSNILDKIFDGYTKHQRLAKASKMPEVVMSFTNFGAILKLIEVNKGAFNIVANSRKVSQYGWDTIEIGSVSGRVLKLVGVQECDDDIIYYIDWSSVKFYTNGLFKRRKAPDGKEYFELRATTGYSYVLDHCVFGDLVCTKPWANAIMHSIPAL
jgi:hypothetical protein